jgi:Family of unknown function (DUF5336)
MTYPPGSPGYPPAQQPTTQFAAPTQQFGKQSDAAPTADGASKLPLYLTAAVAALGLAVYLLSFGPLFTITSSDFPALADFSGASFGLDLAVVGSLFAGLLAGVSLVPKQKPYVALVAVLAVVAFLLVIAELIDKPSVASIGWALYAIIVFSVVQALLAVAVLLFDAGVITPPVPRPRYEQQQQYGQYGGPGQYYGPPQGQQHHGQPQQQQQRPGYPSPYGGGYPGGPSTGGFQPGQQGGPPTPPTGFPTYGQPPSSNAPTTQVQAQPQSSSPSQSGPAPS